MSKILYTLTDEAPFLATASFLPIVQAYARSAGVVVETRDISLSARILAQFPQLLGERAVSDDLAELGELAKTPEANIIKLPNISASVPQLKAAIKELQDKGYPLPDYPDAPQGEREKDIKQRYDRTKGSAVNPVLREGNSDRRAPASVKAYAKKHPHRMGKWDAASQSHVANMESGDFYGSEQSYTMVNPGNVRIEYTSVTGSSFPLRGPVPVQAGEVIDAAVLDAKALADFVDAQIADAKARDVLFSLHLKATMMKVSDPIMFGIVVSRFYAPVLEKHPRTLAEIGFDPNNGIGDLYAKLGQLPESQRAAIEADISA
ncbi:MAG TPA: NADP-dependent isocitrate dehydrogenase, partial [Thermomonas sp.]|nr:NADP-dependent isocitrate dehydrogenase [Thermomonas sp.]